MILCGLKTGIIKNKALNKNIQSLNVFKDLK